MLIGEIGFDDEGGMDLILNSGLLWLRLMSFGESNRLFDSSNFRGDSRVAIERDG